MSNKRIITYTEYGELIDKLCKKLKNNNPPFCAVYGLPRGGLPIAVHISHILNIPMINNLNQFSQEFRNGLLLIVDDIIDTGKTYERFIEYAAIQNIQFYSSTMFYKPCSEHTPNLYLEETEEWIVFPWETIDEKPSEYHQQLYSDIFDDVSNSDTIDDDEETLEPPLGDNW